MREMTEENYTFGDSDRASARLRRLAELYESETRDLLLRGGTRAPRFAVDLGCGPGWSTRLLQQTLKPERTVGLDASERYIAEARRNHGAGLEFQLHDIVRAPFPVPAADAMLCRFLLTHVTSPGRVLGVWASAAERGARLFVHETESLQSEHPALRRYYELVRQLQSHYGQMLYVGRVLEACFAGSGWRLVESERRVLEKPARQMAELHLVNLRMWRDDEFARRVMDRGELDSLDASLERIAEGVEDGGMVLNAARQIIAERE